MSRIGEHQAQNVYSAESQDEEDGIAGADQIAMTKWPEIVTII